MFNKLERLLNFTDVIINYRLKFQCNPYSQLLARRLIVVSCPTLHAVVDNL